MSNRDPSPRPQMVLLRDWRRHSAAQDPPEDDPGCPAWLAGRVAGERGSVSDWLCAWEEEETCAIFLWPPATLEDHLLHVLSFARVTDAQLTLEQEFLTLAENWRNDTAVLSSITMKSMHPAYQRIIGMGSTVVPLILRELEREPDDWFWALNAITGEDPIPPEDAGYIDKMAEAWLNLGRERGWI